MPCYSDKRNGNKLFVCSKYDCTDTIVNNGSDLYQRTEHAHATFTRLENKVWFEYSAGCVEKLIDSS